MQLHNKKHIIKKIKKINRQTFTPTVLLNIFARARITVGVVNNMKHP